MMNPTVLRQRAMYGVVGVMLCLLVFNGMGRELAAADWETYTSDEGRFLAKFPGKVSVKRGANATHFSASPEGVDADFRVAITDRPASDENLEAAFNELKRIRQATAEGQMIEIEEELDYLFAGLPACRFSFLKKVDDNVAARYHAIYILDDKRFYQLMCGFDSKMPLKEDMDIFFKSFRITK